MIKQSPITLAIQHYAQNLGKTDQEYEHVESVFRMFADVLRTCAVMGEPLTKAEIIAKCQSNTSVNVLDEYGVLRSGQLDLSSLKDTEPEGLCRISVQLGEKHWYYTFNYRIFN